MKNKTEIIETENGHIYYGDSSHITPSGDYQIAKMNRVKNISLNVLKSEEIIEVVCGSEAAETLPTVYYPLEGDTLKTLLSWRETLKGKK